jgi:lipase maturation factor 1
MLLGAAELMAMLAPENPISAAVFAFTPELVNRAEIVNTYGLFAMMTTTRPELVIEGSNDNVTWKEYTFRYKPGPLNRSLPIVAPYQPRLDWQMWFAALGSYQENQWVGGLLYRLLTGDSGVLTLLESPPFTTPPRSVRVLIYDYRFTTPAERARSGAVWQRQLLGTWYGPVTLKRSSQ